MPTVEMLKLSLSVEQKSRAGLGPAVEQAGDRRGVGGALKRCHVTVQRRQVAGPSSATARLPVQQCFAPHGRRLSAKSVLAGQAGLAWHKGHERCPLIEKLRLTVSFRQQLKPPCGEPLSGLIRARASLTAAEVPRPRQLRNRGPKNTDQLLNQSDRGFLRR